MSSVGCRRAVQAESGALRRGAVRRTAGNYVAGRLGLSGGRIRVGRVSGGVRVGDGRQQHPDRHHDGSAVPHAASPGARTDGHRAYGAAQGVRRGSLLRGVRSLGPGRAGPVRAVGAACRRRDHAAGAGSCQGSGPGFRDHRLEQLAAGPGASGIAGRVLRPASEDGDHRRRRLQHGGRRLHRLLEGERWGGRRHLRVLDRHPVRGGPAGLVGGRLHGPNTRASHGASGGRAAVAARDPCCAILG